MAKVILGMTMSLDGFVNDRNGDVSRLYSDLEALRTTAFLQEVVKTTGAVVMGRHAFAMADDPDWFAGNYEFQVPIFVLTHAAPAKHPKETDTLKFSFVTDGIESAIQQAKAAAGEKDVQVIGGATTFQQCLQARLCDELHIGIMPVLLGDGLKLFEHMDAEPMQLEKITVIDSPPDRTDMLFRIVK